MNFVTNITKCTNRERLTLQTNGGHRTFSKLADLKLLPVKVHFDEFSLATVLAVKDLTKIEGVVLYMDTSKDKSISVKIGKSKVIKFIECESGLYYYDTEQPEKHIELFNDTNKTVEK